MQCLELLSFADVGQNVRYSTVSISIPACPAKSSVTPIADKDGISVSANKSHIGKTYISISVSITANTYRILSHDLHPLVVSILMSATGSA